MKAGVEKAVGELRKAFAGHLMQVAESPCGGAYVLIEDVPLGGPFAQAMTWVGFFLTNACPEADTYPFYVRPDLSRTDGAALKAPPLHGGHRWPPGVPAMPERQAVMVSRRQKNQTCWGRESPLAKLQAVLKWMQNQ
jgi:hypothetical protein